MQNVQNLFVILNTLNDSSIRFPATEKTSKGPQKSNTSTSSKIRIPNTLLGILEKFQYLKLLQIK